MGLKVDIGRRVFDKKKGLFSIKGFNGFLKLHPFILSWVHDKEGEEGEEEEENGGIEEKGKEEASDKRQIAGNKGKERDDE